MLPVDGARTVIANDAATALPFAAGVNDTLTAWLPPAAMFSDTGAPANLALLLLDLGRFAGAGKRNHQRAGV